MTFHSSRVLLGFLASFGLWACGGRVDPGAEGAPGSGGPTPGPVTPGGGGQRDPLAAGTLAVGQAFGGVRFYPPGAVTGTPALGHLDAPADEYEPQYMTFDADGGLYVGSFLAQQDAGEKPWARVDVFKPGSLDATPPVRTIVGPHTGITDPRGMVVDRAGFLYVANGVVPGYPQGATSSVLVFAPAANGDVAPVRTIQTALPLFWLPSGLALNRSDELIVGDSEGSALEIFPSETSGTRSPTRQITGQFSDTTGVAVDAEDRVYVGDWSTQSVTIFGGMAGQDDPVAVLAGDQTGLGAVLDVAVDRDGRICVATEGAGVRVFAKGATGNVAPVAVLAEDGGYNLAVHP